MSKPGGKDAPPAPRIFPDAHVRVPVLLRQKAVDLIYAEYVRLLSGPLPGPDVYMRAAAEAMRVDRDTIHVANERLAYQSHSTAKLVALRREKPPVDAKGKRAAEDDAETASLESDAKRMHISSSASPRNIETRRRPPLAAPLDAVDADVLAGISSLVLSEEDRVAYGFLLRPSDAPSPLMTRERDCERCGRPFIPRALDPDEEGDCMYHPMKLSLSTNDLRPTMAYKCCNAPPRARGCTYGPHVHKAPEDFPHLVVTCLDAPPSARALVALDCEMVYTVLGRELARLSAVDERGHVLLDRHVRPVGAVVDYNTAHSGVTAARLAAGDVVSFAAARDELLRAIGPQTVLVGHALENDLCVLGIAHGRLVDSAVLYARVGKNNKPYRLGLQRLAEEELRIALDRAGGHDSLDDAIIALRLVVVYVTRRSRRS